MKKIKEGSPSFCFRKHPFTSYWELVQPIITSSEFQKRKTYYHHGVKTVYEHSIAVSYYSYRIALLFHLDTSAVAIGGLLHDFYTRPWQDDPNHYSFFEQHAFRHPREAAQNAYLLYPEYMNPKIANIIRRHMFPLTLIPPLYIESWLVMLMDKYLSLEALCGDTSIFKLVRKERER